MQTLQHVSTVLTYKHSSLPLNLFATTYVRLSYNVKLRVNPINIILYFYCYYYVCVELRLLFKLDSTIRAVILKNDWGLLFYDVVDKLP